MVADVWKFRGVGDEKIAVQGVTPLKTGDFGLFFFLPTMDDFVNCLALSMYFLAYYLCFLRLLMPPGKLVLVRISWTGPQWILSGSYSKI